MNVLLTAMASEDGVRPPGQTRLVNRQRARTEGLAVPAKLYAQIEALAAAG